MKEIRRRYEQLVGERNHLLTKIKTKKKLLIGLKAQLEKQEQAREIIRAVGLKTQQELQFHISDITSMALDTVFPEPYQLKVDFVQRRNKTECDLLFIRNGYEIDPLSASGYGAVDVASFALRIASWSMKTPRSRNTIILDEPMRFLSEDYQPMASKMLKEVSDKLGIQFIIITHEEVLTQYADKVFTVKQRDGVSKILENN